MRGQSPAMSRPSKRRELDPTLTALRECLDEARSDNETPAHITARVENMLAFLTDLTGWYEDIAKLPRSTLLKLIRMGGRIGKLVGGRDT